MLIFKGKLEFCLVSSLKYIEIIKRLNGSFDDIPNEVLQKYMQ